MHYWHFSIICWYYFISYSPLGRIFQCNSDKKLHKWNKLMACLRMNEPRGQN